MSNSKTMTAAEIVLEWCRGYHAMTKEIPGSVSIIRQLEQAVEEEKKLSLYRLN